MLGLFSVKIKQTGDYVHITGVSYYDLAKDIEKFYSTSLLTKHQIRRESWDTIKVHNFFLVELHHIVGELLKIRNLRTRRRALSELKELIETETWIKDTVNPGGKPFDLKKLNQFNTVPFPQQLDFLQQYPIIVNSYHLKGMLLDAKPGSGKAMPLSTRVKVPNGWKALGDLKVKDIVVTPGGDTACVESIYPQGITEVYRFYFEDGRTADSHPYHLWKTTVNGIDEILTTLEVLHKARKEDVYFPLVGEINGYSVPCNTSSEAAARELVNTDVVIGDNVLELPYRDRFNIVVSVIEHVGCLISESVLSAYHENRIGMENFRRLMWSIGGTATEPVLVNGLYKVDFKHRDVGKMMTGLIGDNPCVQGMYGFSQYKDLQLKLTHWEKVEDQETCCIALVNDEKLYVVDDYIVTHNTFTSLAWSQLINTAPTVVFCPMNIVDKVWVEQPLQHFKVPPRIWTSISGKVLEEGYDFYIVHYDYMTSGMGKYLENFLIALSKKHKGALKMILDESQNFNDPKAARTRKLIEWCDMELFGHHLPMSGTPLKAQGSEIFPTTCMIDPYFDKKAREFFMASYGRNRPSLMDLLSRRIGRMKFTIPELVGLGDPPPMELVKVKIPNSDQYTLDAIRLQMQIYIGERIAFYTKHMPSFLEFYNDVLTSYELSIQGNAKAVENLVKYKQIVHRFRTRGYNSFTDNQDSQFCKRVEEDIEKGLKGTALKDFRNIKSAVKYLGLKLRGEALGNVLGRARINAIKDTIAHAGLPELIDNVEKKTLIFTSYVDALKLCEEYLTKVGYPNVTVYGENSSERDTNIKRFEKDPTLRALIAIFDSLKEGYPLIMANLTILLNAPFREYEVKQVQARTWRTGQDAPCYFKLLDMDTGDKLNIMTRSINIMEWSKEQVDILMSKEQGHELLGNITGQEMFDMGDEPETHSLYTSRSVLSLF